MSVPQHIGDLIMPQLFGHLATATVSPVSVVMWSCTSSASHFTHYTLHSLNTHSTNCADNFRHQYFPYLSRRPLRQCRLVVSGSAIGQL